MSILKTYNNSIKKRCLKINNIYDIKWDFKADFLTNKYKEKNKIKKNTKICENINNDRLVSVCHIAVAQVEKHPSFRV